MSSVRVSLAVALTVVFGAAWQAKGANLTLLDAIRANDGERVRTLLAGGADPNTADSNQTSPLMYAGLYAGPRVLSLLVGAGADLNLRDKNGLTALAWAVHSYESAKVLIDAGADVNAKSNIGGTPFLTAAAYPRNAALLRLMLAKGANIKIAVFGSTALTVAALSGDADGAAVSAGKRRRPESPWSGRTLGPSPGGDAGRSTDGEVAPRRRGQTRSAYLTGRGCPGTVWVLERPVAGTDAAGTGNRSGEKGQARSQRLAFRGRVGHGHAAGFRDAPEGRSVHRCQDRLRRWRTGGRPAAGRCEESPELLGGSLLRIEPVVVVRRSVRPAADSKPRLPEPWICWQRPAHRWSTKRDASPAITRACLLLPDGTRAVRGCKGRKLPRRIGSSSILSCNVPARYCSTVWRPPARLQRLPGSSSDSHRMDRRPTCSRMWRSIISRPLRWRMEAGWSGGDGLRWSTVRLPQRRLR